MIEEVLSVKWQVLSRARRGGVLSQSSYLELSAERRLARGNPPVRHRRWRFCAKNPEYRFGLCGILVFWYSGILGWRPEKRVFGTLALCVFGTWHVAVWIFGAKTRGTGGNWIGEADGWVFDCGLRIVQNEPNSPPRRLGPGRPIAQNEASSGHRAGGGPRTGCTNKPNFRRHRPGRGPRNGRVESNRAKQTQLGRSARTVTGEMCKTKPILVQDRWSLAVAGGPARPTMLQGGARNRARPDEPWRKRAIEDVD